METQLLIYIYINDGSKYYFDIMTVKNNLKSCEVLKLKIDLGEGKIGILCFAKIKNTAAS